MTVVDDLERRIRERKVRVEERLELLRILQEPGAEDKFAAKQAKLLDAARRAANKLKGTAA